MGEKVRDTQRTQSSRLASGRGLLIGIVLGAIGAIAIGQLERSDRLIRTPFAPFERPGADPHALALDKLAGELAAEVQARKELTNRVAELDEQLSMLRFIRDEAAATSRLDGDPAEGLTSGEIKSGQDAVAKATGFDDEALLSRGIHPSEVARLRDLWESHELARASIANRAIREGWFLKPRHSAELAQLDQALREDLQDEEFDRYLYALGKPNRLKAGEILRDSSASRAGLRQGDFILRYDDVRVFNPGDLLLASSRGVPGESVPVNILRDGREQTVYIERGPLGAMIEHSRGEPLRD